MNAWKRPDPNPLRRDFYEARCLSIADKKIAVAIFRGEAAATHELLHVFSAMEGAMTELLEAEHPAALILDFRELAYSWGDEMVRTLDVPSTWFGGEFPLVVITSDLNRDGLTSLLRDEMLSEPAEWLSQSEDEAIALIRSKFLKKKA
jgi:hypothetical protein